MKNNYLFFIPIILLYSLDSQGQLSGVKQEIVSSIENHQSRLINISDQIWALAETALEETQSAELLSNYAKENGFKVEMGVAGMPTAFVATYGSGRPIISVLGEFDALPGLSQKASPDKDPYRKGQLVMDVDTIYLVQQV